MGKDELKKNLGLVPALALVIGIVIGAGVFFKPTAVFTATGAPGRGILLGIISIILIFSGKFDRLTDLLIFVIWIFYVMTFFAVFVLRKKKPDMERPYKVPGYPIVPAIAILGGLYIIFNTLFTQPLNAGLGLIGTLIGFPIYMIRKNKFKKIDNKED
ncbi:hypothetical protein ACYUJ6_12350 [Clostridium sp. JNZ X4-2]